MTSTKARSAGLGAVATFAGLASSLGWAGAAHADGTTAAFGNDHEQTACQIDRNDVQFAPADAKGAPAGGWQPAAGFHRLQDEPQYGIVVRIADDGGHTADPGCTRTISLASYTAGGATWETSKLQGFVGVAHVTLDKHHTSGLLTVPLPSGGDGKPCYGQLDLYFGDTVYDGKTGAGHGPLPNYPDSTTPPPKDLIAAWNGGSDKCAAPPTTPPPSSPPSSSHSTPPTSAPSTPPSSASSTPPSSAPSTPPTTPTTPPVAGSTTPPPATTSSPGTPTLAHTGSNAGVISLVALGFFGAGGTVVMASRKAAAARKH